MTIRINVAALPGHAPAAARAAKQRWAALTDQLGFTRKLRVAFKRRAGS
ncbi:hypothetical protein AB5J62_09395 [Amycolatopsis sp. cg5]